MGRKGFSEKNGITQQEWQEMASDPEVSREAYLKSVRDYARRITKRKRNSKGQFVSGGAPASGDSNDKWETTDNGTTKAARYKPSQESLKRAKDGDHEGAYRAAVDDRHCE